MISRKLLIPTDLARNGRIKSYKLLKALPIIIIWFEINGISSRIDVFMIASINETRSSRI